MRILLVALILLVLGLVAESLFDSAIGAWIAFGSLMAIVAMRLLGWIGLGCVGSADTFDSGD